MPSTMIDDAESAAEHFKTEIIETYGVDRFVHKSGTDGWIVEEYPRINEQQNSVLGRVLEVEDDPFASRMPVDLSSFPKVSVKTRDEVTRSRAALCTQLPRLYDWTTVYVQASWIFAPLLILLGVGLFIGGIVAVIWNLQKPLALPAPLAPDTDQKGELSLEILSGIAVPALLLVFVFAGTFIHRLISIVTVLSPALLLSVLGMVVVSVGSLNQHQRGWLKDLLPLSVKKR